jgi:TonB family protein
MRLPLQSAAALLIASLASCATQAERPKDRTERPKERVLDVLRAHRPDVRLCADRAEADLPSSRLKMRFILLPSGRTASISVAPRFLQSSELARCLARQVRTWTFPPDPSATPLPVDFPVSVPGNRSKPDLSTLTSTVEGGLTEAEIGGVIRRNLARFKYCYEGPLAEDNKLEGMISVNFVVGPTGAVTDASVKDTTMHNERVEACAVHVARTLKFPEPRGGGAVIVAYPFLFTPH